jgi:hypothetical protein
VGFLPFFDLGDVSLLSLFSAGGATNPDLPVNSGYRKTTPMAATLRFQGGQQFLVPWPIDWESTAYTVRNGFHRPVVVVGDVAVQAFAAGRVEREVAIPHTLDAAAHEESSRDSHLIRLR